MNEKEENTIPYHYCEFEYIATGMCGEIALHKVETKDGKNIWLCYEHLQQLRMEEMGWDRYWKERR